LQPGKAARKAPLEGTETFQSGIWVGSGERLLQGLVGEERQNEVERKLKVVFSFPRDLSNNKISGLDVQMFESLTSLAKL